MLAGPERLQNAHVKIGERAAAHAVASGHVPIDDGAVIVVKAGSTSCDLVERTVQALGRERIFGVVLNRANENAQTSEYYDYYRYYAAAN